MLHMQRVSSSNGMLCQHWQVRAAGVERGTCTECVHAGHGAPHHYGPSMVSQAEKTKELSHG
jgi:hypothetical protein